MTIVAHLQGRPLPTRLRLDKGFQPCAVEAGDEMYANEIFEFNITRLLAFVQEELGSAFLRSAAQIKVF
jgi:hypothetical protein